jgi:predicted deacylase
METFAGAPCPPGRVTSVPLAAGTREDGSPITIPVLVLPGYRAGPTLLLVGLLHGTEIVGAEIISRVLHDVRPEELAGRLLGVPVANPLAYLEHAQTALRDGVNMNRVFPGDSGGSITQRMAHVLYTHAVRAADAVIDFHTNSFPALHWVIAKIDERPESRRSLELAQAFGLTLGRYSRARERQLVGTLVDAALDLGIPGILVELTAHTMLLSGSVTVGVRGTRNVMRALAMLPGEREPQDDTVVVAAGFTTNNRLRAGAGGLVHHLKRPGEPVGAGDIVAVIRTPTGAVVEEVRTPVAGFVLSYPRFRNQAVMSGDHVAFIASVD